MLFPKHLRCSDLQGKPLRVTIADLTRETVCGEQKAVLSFTNRNKLILNKTNARAIARTLGEETSEWVGRDIILVPAVVNFRGDLVDAIRIRAAPARPATAEDEPPTNGSPNFQCWSVVERSWWRFCFIAWKQLSFSSEYSVSI